MSSSTLKVGFIGMGIMGAPMARNLLKAGWDLTVYNRTASRCQELAAAGAKIASNPAELAATCDIVLSCVTANADVLEVILEGQNAVARLAAPARR